jgi:hypothetical protein
LEGTDVAKKKGSTTPSPVDPRAILRQAACFEFTSDLLSNATATWNNRLFATAFELLKAGPTPHTPDGKVFKLPDTLPEFASIEMSKEMLFRNPTLAPSIVVQAFATELYLKCMLARGGGSIPQLHELLALFQKLSPAQQTRIEKLYEEDCGTDALMQRLSQTDFAGKKFTMTQALTEMNTAFIQWRYAYEQPGPGNDVVGRPWVAIRTHILELEPEWVTEVADLGIRPTSTGRL